MIVYKITCQVNGKVYIGQTSESLEKRFKRHVGYQKDCNDTKFYRAIRKYGKNNFYIEQIDTATTQEELDEKEIFWIKYYDSVNNGYNTKDSKGKCGGDTLSHHPNKKAISEKIRKSKIGDKNPMRKNGGLKGPRNGMYGKRGAEVCSSKKCIAINKDNNEVIIFDSLTEMKEYFNCTSLSMITNRCCGKVKSPYKNYYFKYYKDYIEGQSTIENYTHQINDVENKVLNNTRSK